MVLFIKLAVPDNSSAQAGELLFIPTASLAASTHNICVLALLSTLKSTSLLSSLIATSASLNTNRFALLPAFFASNWILASSVPSVISVAVAYAKK